MKLNKYNGWFNFEIFYFYKFDLKVDGEDCKLNKYLDFSYGKAFTTKDFTYRFKRNTRNRITNRELIESLDKFLYRNK